MYNIAASNKKKAFRILEKMESFPRKCRIYYLHTKKLENKATI